MTTRTDPAEPVRQARELIEELNHVVLDDMVLAGTLSGVGAGAVGHGPGANGSTGGGDDGRWLTGPVRRLSSPRASSVRDPAVRRKSQRGGLSAVRL